MAFEYWGDFGMVEYNGVIYAAVCNECCLPVYACFEPVLGFIVNDCRVVSVQLDHFIQFANVEVLCQMQLGPFCFGSEIVFPIVAEVFSCLLGQPSEVLKVVRFHLLSFH